MLVGLFFLLVAVAANTESIVVQVPPYFEVPSHNAVFSPTEILPLNSTHSHLADFPIYDKYTYPKDTKELQVLSLDPRHQTLFVKLNNHQNSVYSSGDILYIKLCWPATTPYSFRLSHQYHSEKQLTKSDTSPPTQLSLYLRIDYHGDYYAVKPGPPVPVLMQLTVSKLAWIPIPLELYDFIVYIVDIGILLATIVPLLVPWFTTSFAPKHHIHT